MLLGYLSLSSTRPSPRDHYTCRVGGYPTHDDVPAYSCPECGDRMRLIVQLHAPVPLDDEDMERFLYLFVCNRQTCSRTALGWKAVRKLGTTPSADFELAAADNGSSDSDSDSDMDGLMDLLERHECAMLKPLSLAPSKTPDPKSVFKLSAIEFEEESTSSTNSASSTTSTHSDVEIDDAPSDEAYEKREKTSADRFLSAISKNPQQVLRYSRGGSPLLINAEGAACKARACARCGAPLVFEFQVLPTLISLLGTSKSGVNLDFGNVIVYTCTQLDCGGADKYVEEVVKVEEAI